ncbi:hypothetical protein BN11_4980002 [Nostocoides australiense Ben110]|uniref:Uncharacterized protein n=1 Tax=Nostocoides australiense Ben110 TaxID=1193182 RepID=W6JZC8_9MICO|nr:hypothetical protein BN11_4980002 [Tetrasphaera australiensis Ben110]
MATASSNTDPVRDDPVQSLIDPPEGAAVAVSYLRVSQGTGREGRPRRGLLHPRAARSQPAQGRTTWRGRRGRVRRRR